MRGTIGTPLAGVTVFLAVGCGGSSNDTAGTSATTTVVVTENTPATDTAASADTTSTDTTSTDTTSTGTATTATGLSAGCQKVADLSTKFGKALSDAGASGTADLDKTAKAFEAFAQQVPEEIRPAFMTVAKAYARYAVALKGIDFKAGQVPDAATIAKLANAAKSLNNQDLTKANTEISAWVTKNCSAAG